MGAIDAKYDIVMIIEDNLIDLFLAKEIINKNNFAKKIVNFDDIAEALIHIKSIQNVSDLPKIIFTDINLGMSSGLDFIDTFRTLPEWKTTNSKIIILSSFFDKEDLARIKAFGHGVTFKEKYLDQHFLNSL